MTEPSPSSAHKGKSRASDPFERSNDLETAPLLGDGSSSTGSTTPAGKRKQPRLRHGRGPLVREDSDGDEPLPSNDSGDEESGTVRLVSDHPAQHARARWTWSSIACLVFAFIFCVSLLALAILHIWIGRLVSEQARHGTAEEMAQRGMVWAGPSAVRVQASEGREGLVVEVDGMAGIDVRKALDWEEKDKGGWVRRMEGRIARWGVRKARSVTVDVGEVAIYDASGNADAFSSSSHLILVNSLDSLRIPLSYPTLAKPLPTMHPFTLHIPLSFPSPRDLADFAKGVYHSKDYRIRAEIREIAAQVGDAKVKGPAGWLMRRLKATKVTALARIIEGKLPDVPTDTNPAEMVNLTSYGVYETSSPAHPNETVIALSASAIFQNPLADAIRQGRLPVVAWGVPFRLPISVHLPLPPLPQQKPGAPTEIALAKISSLPFFFPADSESAKLDISGHLVPAGNLTPPTTRPPTPSPKDGASTINSSDQPPLSRALSRFVARYLSGRPNDIYIRYDSAPEPPLLGDPAPDAPFPPRFVADMVEGQTFHVEVPGTNETPDFFKNLRMEDMKIRLGGGDDSNADLLATGKVVGEVVLPDAAKKLAKGIDAKVIWPDVLVYDGELPPHPYAQEEGEDIAAAAPDQLSFPPSVSIDDSDSTAYPPSPVPRNAFARMRPAQPMLAKTIHTPANSTHNATTLVEAAFVDAPLYLLPGRGDVLRRFVGKIIFGGNRVKASMAGITSVRIGLSGFGEVELVEIPIEASFMVGRGGIENPPPFAGLVGLH
ncbi:hypothetical protein Rt10032_c10g4363 [Rhodotorula toruloides]|uniref:Uncharacterized protein n=1 Tax=Rhodotorula toruloides TaxID=5286 RepID=A0A511KKF7_RHOTO|nr:hypothetical protein Rt10032_c10g4363 [Rhodotorula toruloides]